MSSLIEFNDKTPTEYTKIAEAIKNYKFKDAEHNREAYAEKLLRQKRKELAEILLEIPEIKQDIAQYIKNKEDMYYSPLVAGSYVDIFQCMAEDWSN